MKIFSYILFFCFFTFFCFADFCRAVEDDVFSENQVQQHQINEMFQKYGNFIGNYDKQRDGSEKIISLLDKMIGKTFDWKGSVANVNKYDFIVCSDDSLYNSQLDSHRCEERGDDIYPTCENGKIPKKIERLGSFFEYYCEKYQTITKGVIFAYTNTQLDKSFEKPKTWIILETKDPVLQKISIGNNIEFSIKITKAEFLDQYLFAKNGSTSFLFANLKTQNAIIKSYK